MCECRTQPLNKIALLTKCIQCSKLTSSLPRRVLSPKSSAYTQANNHRWSTTSILAPKCIVQPIDTAEVASVITMLTSEATSDLPACPFAVKSGGHTPFAGANNIDGGIVLDLSRLDSTHLSADQKVVSIGPGSTWQAAANKLNGTGIGIPTGRCPSTAVGGVTLGGGISFFAPKIGFAADNVLNYEVVLASGAIVNANATSNPDLWTALKGSGGNLGIVTRFDFAAFFQPSLWSAGIPLPADEASTNLALAAMSGITQMHRMFPKLAYGNMFSFNASRTPYEGEIWNSVVFSGDDIKELALPAMPVTIGGVTTELKLTDHMHETTLAKLLEESDTFPWGYRNYIATIAFVNDLPTLSHVHDITVELYKTVRHVPDMEWLFAYEPLPHMFSEHSMSRGGNMLGLNRTKDDLILMQLAPRWKSAGDDRVMQDTAKQWVKQVKGYTQSVGKASDYLYLNYADGFQDPIVGYGEESVRFLQGVSRKYDRNGVFQKAVKGGFKIPGMSVAGGSEHDEL
jgi:FAD/FMN-containing dehydrogenase